MPDWALIACGVMGGAALIASAFYGLQFYPPGMGYEEEARNNRRALILMLCGLFLIAIPIAVTIMAQRSSIVAASTDQ